MSKSRRTSCTAPDVVWRYIYLPVQLVARERLAGWGRVGLVLGALGGTAFVISLAAQPASPPQGRAAMQAEALSLPVVGPQRGITCPVNAVNIPPGTNIQRVVDSRPGLTTFCLKAGVHVITSAITPKTGNTFVGEYGATLDGTGWTTTDSTQAAFRAHNQDIDDVTIRNVVIRHMPQRGIHAFYWMSDRWIVEYTEITDGRNGISLGNQSVVRHSWIHHNVGNPSSPIPSERGGGYQLSTATNVLFEENEISYNGPEQKVTLSTNVTFRDNFVHHNLGDGIWYDGDNVGSLIERNRVEDNPSAGIFYEISGRGIIRNNAIRRSGDNGVFISTSRDVEIHNNRLEDNFHGIVYFVNCGAVGGGAIGWDLANDIAHDNIVKVAARSGSYANGLSSTPDCTPEQLAAYMNGSKGLEFTDNQYVVPSTIDQYWFWGSGSLKSFSDWQRLGWDHQGSVTK